MASSFPGTLHSTALVFSAAKDRELNYSQIYDQHCHRIYSLAFWMTGNELLAEDLSRSTFLRVFSRFRSPESDQVDRAFLAEVREFCPLGSLTLSAPVKSAAQRVIGNIKRIHLERAVLQLPATEKLIFLLHDVENYTHEKIARLLGVSEDDTRSGLHQARLRVRELLLLEF